MTDLATIDNRPPIVVLRERFEARKAELKNALPDNIKPDHFIRVVMNAATFNPEIQACTFQSIWQACLRACQDGLLPDGKHGAIVPFKGRATWIPMYRGLVSKFMRSGQFKEIAADVVRQGEEFKYYRDQDGVKFLHVPGDNDDALIQKIYAIAHTLEGGIFVAVLSIGEANKIRNMSRATREDAPWKIWPAEMYKKTALRRLAKLLPTADDILGDDEPEPYLAPPLAAGKEQEPRASGPALADASPPRSPDEGGEHDGGPDGANAQSLHDTDPPAVPLDASGEPIAESERQRAVRQAYERGKDAKSRGIRRSACPGEFRDDNQLNTAWALGWSGEMFPADWK